MGILSRIVRRVTRAPTSRRIMQSGPVRSYRARAVEEAAVRGAEKYHKREGKKEARLAYAQAVREARVEQARAKAKADAIRPSLAHRIGQRLIEGPRQPRYAPRSTYYPQRRTRRRYAPAPPPPPMWGFQPASVERKRREERRKWGY